MGVVFKHKGDFKNTEAFLKRMSKADFFKHLNELAREGVSALASATPIESGVTATSWGYEIHNSRGSCEIIWTNSNIVDGVPIAIILQYGHATGTGGYVQGRDYINPAIRPVFDRISEEVWKEVTRK